MSGILIPFYHPTGTINGEGDPVHIDHVLSVSKVTALRPADTSIGQDSIEIVFNIGGNNNIQQVTWKFSTEGARDSSYDDLLAEISNEIA